MYVSGEPEQSYRSDRDQEYDAHPSTRKFLAKLETNDKDMLGQINEVEENESDGSYGNNEKYSSPSKKKTRDRRRRRKEREQ